MIEIFLGLGRVEVDVEKNHKSVVSLGLSIDKVVHVVEPVRDFSGRVDLRKVRRISLGRQVWGRVRIVLARFRFVFT